VTFGGAADAVDARIGAEIGAWLYAGIDAGIRAGIGALFGGRCAFDLLRGFGGNGLISQSGI
jgi:hypothetical protein